LTFYQIWDIMISLRAGQRVKGELMPDNPRATKTIFVRVPDEEVLLLLRDFLEPLGYRVEFAKDVKSQQTLLDSIKVASGALLMIVGSEIVSQLEAV
jgi:hypothetical protein